MHLVARAVDPLSLRYSTIDGYPHQEPSMRLPGAPAGHRARLCRCFVLLPIMFPRFGPIGGLAMWRTELSSAGLGTERLADCTNIGYVPTQDRSRPQRRSIQMPGRALASPSIATSDPAITDRSQAITCSFPETAWHSRD